MAEASVRRLTIGLVAALCSWSGCAYADGKITISRAVWGGFQQYQAWLTPVGSGFYAITTDGAGGAGSGCPSGHCNAGPSTREMAIAQCEKANAGRSCVIFAENQKPVIDYEIGQ